MERLVKNTEEDSGVWQVMCCASNTYAKRLSEFEQLRVEHEALKAHAPNTFASEESRKRPRDTTETSGPKDIWQEFGDNMRGKGYSPVI